MNPQSGTSARPIRINTAANFSAPLPPRRCRGDGAAVFGIHASAVRPGSGAGRRGGCFAFATTWACCPSRSSRGMPAVISRSRRTCGCCGEHRADFTVLSGVSHPGVDGGHPVGHLLPDRGPAPGQQFFPQLNFARPTRGRADRRANAVSLADAGSQRRPWPVLDALWRGDSAGGPGVTRVQPALPTGHARRDRSPDPRNRHRAEHLGCGRRTSQGT